MAHLRLRRIPLPATKRRHHHYQTWVLGSYLKSATSPKSVFAFPFSFPYWSDSALHCNLADHLHLIAHSSFPLQECSKMIGCTQRKPCCQTMSNCLLEFGPVYGLVLLCSRSHIRCSVVMTFHWSQTTPKSQTQSLNSSYNQLISLGKKIH